jgi:hypothetical protein
MLWNARRWGLFDALTQQSDLFADLYRRTIDALSERPLTHGALVVAGHCIRDLVNGLPDVMTDAGSVPPYVNPSKPAQTLATVWQRYPDLLGAIDIPIVAPPARGEEVEPLMSVPVAVAEAARRVAEASLAGTYNSRRRRSALVLGRMDVKAEDATVRLFQKSVDVFEEARHPQRGRDLNVEESIKRVDHALGVIEAALEARIGSFFRTLEDLTDVLDAANERSQGDRK